MFTRDRLNQALFVLLAFFALGFCLLSGAEILVNKAQLIFLSEFAFVFFYTAINPKPPSETVKSNPRVATGLLTWTVLSLLIFAYGQYTGERSSFAEPYPYMAFHGVFSIYVMAVFGKMQVFQGQDFKNTVLKRQKRELILFYLLCLLTFSIALSSSNNSFITANIVMGHELLFIFSYAFTLNSVPDFSKFIRNNTGVTVLLVCWFLSMTLSFFVSPYALTTQVGGVDRYYQTFIHMLFFIIAYQFLLDSVYARKHKDWLLFMLPLSVVFLTVVFVAFWFSIEDIHSIDWFVAPPLNQHIRHTGYIVAAASVIAMVFSLHTNNSGKQITLYSLLMLVSTAFVFWTGGRAASISVVFTFFLIVAFLAYVRSLKLRAALLACIVLALGVFVSEKVKVFDWNGIVDQSKGSAGRLVAETREDDSGLGIVEKEEVSVVIRDVVLEEPEPDRSVTRMRTTQVLEEFVEVEVERVRSEAEIALNLFVTGRLGIWSTVLDSLDGHWLLGLGPQSYFLMPNRNFGVHPHNLFLQFLLEWGVIGTTLFLVLMAWALIRIFSLLKTSTHPPSTSLLSSVAVLVTLTLYGLVDGTYFHGQPVYYLMLALAVCLSDRSVKQAE